MRALAYCRYNPENPASGNDAKRSFEAFCVSGGHADYGFHSDPYDDKSQPQWHDMISAIDASGLGYLVLISSASDLGEGLQQQVNRLLLLDDKDCQVVVDDYEAPDPLQLVVKAAQGSPRQMAHRERIREGMRAKAALGLGLGKPPYGYRVGPDGVLRPVLPEADVVREMFRLYAEGVGGVRTVARILNEQGYRTRRGESWSMVTIRDILRNTAYIGTYRRFGLRLPGTYEPIVDTETFRLVQQRMQDRAPAQRNAPSIPYLLSGLLYCGYCGHRMMGVTRRQTWRRKDGERARKEYRYYQCQSRINRGECGYRTVRAEVIEDAVVERARLLQSPSIDPARSPWTANEVEESTAKIRSLDKRYQLVVKRASAGGMSLGQLRVAVHEIEMARQHAIGLSEIAAASGSRQHDLVESEREKLELIWDDLDQQERQQTLKTLIAYVEYTDSGISVIAR